MKTIYRLLFAGVIIAVLFTACQREELAPLKSASDHLAATTDSVVLGEQLPNPYTVENMTKAYNQLYPNGRIQSLRTSHLYVRFFPRDYSEVNRLTEDSTLSLYTHPLDYEIIKDGEAYRDPELPSNAVMSFYTVLKPGHQFPEVDYDILEKLYIPEDDQLEDKAFELVGYSTTNNGTASNGRLMARKYRPNGRILVEDNVLRRNVPLRGARVKIRDWFKIANATTDNNGYWRSDKEYRARVDVKVIFENSRMNIRSTFFETHWAARDKIHNEDRPKGAQVVINRNNSKVWAWATVFNGVMEYYDYCVRFGIKTPPGNMNLYVHRKKGDPAFGGSAPMFSKGFKYYRLDWDNGWRWLANVLYIPVSNTVMNLLMKNHMPDIIYNYDQNNVPNSDRVLNTMYHELGHASHYAKVGNGFWGRYIKYITSHGSYGDGTENDAGLVGLSESWGFHIGPFLVNTKYGRRTNLDAIVFRSGWIPAGIHHDLIDTGELSLTGITDNVSGYSTAQIFSCMDSGTDSPTRFRDNLRNRYSNSTETHLNNLFSGYGY